MKKIKQLIIKLMEESKFFDKIFSAVLPIYWRHLQTRQNKIFLQQGAKVLAHFKDVLDAEKLKFWLTCGTLLGAYREHRLLGHDLDLDVAMFAEDREKVQKALLAGGFKLEHEFGVAEDGIKEQSYYYQKVKIDIFFVEKNKDSFVAHVFFREKESSQNDNFNVVQIFFPQTDFMEYDFLGNKYLIPEKTDDYLAANYGKDFMTPNKNWDYRKDIPSAKYFSIEEKRGVRYI